MTLEIIQEYYQQFQEIASNQVFQEYGVAGLFINAVLSATAIPFPTEILTISLLAGGEDPIIIGVVLLAGSSIGGVLNYAIGFGGNKLFRKFKKKETKDNEKGHKWLKRLGWTGIFFSPFILVVGDFILISAGATRYNFKRFLLLMIAGKALKVIVTVIGLGVIF